MKNILIPIFKQAMTELYGPDYVTDPSLQSATRADYGDYQANFAMRLAKMLQQKPIDIAEAVIAHLQGNPLFASLKVSGPGFINIQLSPQSLSQALQNLVHDERLGVAKHSPHTVVVDYANANVAKEMHVGHIRSIVIGDAIVRLLEFLGDTVIRQSHLGDWGTQFGMLIEYILQTHSQENIRSSTENLAKLDQLYKAAKKLFDEDAEFATRSRSRVVALQSGDEKTRAIWQQLVEQSLSYFQKIYEKLGVLLIETDTRGESFYNAMLAGIVHELEEKNLAILDADAKVIFLENFETPFIIQKKDGGYLYATTDLAAAKFRIHTLQANRLIYLTDARQRQHFDMLFAAVRKAQWADETIRLEHVFFGTILGPDNKPFKTRSGESVRLISLIDEAEKRAADLIRTKNPDISTEELAQLARTIGIGALKYADLRTDKIKDYVFDWDKLLSFDGNTAPYLQNAYVRIRAIFRKGGIDPTNLQHTPILLTEAIEHSLAVKLLELSDVLYSVNDDLSLHHLCDYLYTLASLYHKFYEQCPILSDANHALRQSRLVLSDLVARALKLGLHLLGIETLEKM